MTKELKHIELIKNYLKENNLSPFEIKIENNLVQIKEYSIDFFCKNPIDNMYLINSDEINDNENGYISFERQHVNIDYFDQYHLDDDDLTILTDEHKEKYHIRESNVYINRIKVKEKKGFWSFLSKSKEIDKKYLVDYVFYKNTDINMPLSLSKKEKVLTNNYYLILNT